MIQAMSKDHSVASPLVTASERSAGEGLLDVDQLPLSSNWTSISQWIHLGNMVS